MRRRSWRSPSTCLGAERAARARSPRLPRARLRLAGKGVLEPGADADIALLDPAGAWTVAREDLLDRHKLSPFAGRTLRGRVVRTILRGRTVAIEGRIAAEPAGRIVHPSG